MISDLNDYIEAHISREPEYLKKIDRDSNLYYLNGRMCSGHVQGRLLKMLVAMIRPKRVLELGTFTGYSALCVAEALENDAIIDTIEIDDELEDFIREHLCESPYNDNIHLHIGDALEIIDTLEDDFDLVFIDANKRHYLDYYHKVLPRVKSGGYIIADNTIWYEKVTEENSRHDAQTEGIIAFNNYIATDDRVEKVIVPVRDGLTIIYKKP